MKKFLSLLILTIFGGLIVTSQLVSANVDNFQITDYDVEIQLSRDSEQRSTLTTVETITAEFPNSNQNRGIERAIPKSYDGHDVSLNVINVSRPDGSKWQYTTYDDSNDNKVVRIGDADTYVQGTQTYVITYEQRDVTRQFDDTDRDEWYWDINGTDWRVPIRWLTVSVTIDEELRDSLTDNSACYRGTQGSTDRCDLDLTAEGFRAQALNLRPGENITLAVGFENDTFTGYQMTWAERAFNIWLGLQLFLIPVAVVLIVWVIVRFVRTTNRSRELGTIVPEYLPPENASVTVSARIAKHAYGSVMAAQLLDLAVRRYIKLSEQETKAFIGKSKLYFVEIIKSLNDLRPEEQELLSDMFGHLPEVGESLSLQTLQSNNAYYKRTTDNDKKLRKLILEKYELRKTDQSLKRWLRMVALVAVVISVLVLSPPLLFLAIVAFSLSFVARSLTNKGLDLRRYLAGLRDYIKVAETDRLKMLQSPEGAAKVSEISDNPTNEKQRIVLYERVLPYAVLFRQEKEWAKQLGKYYEQAGKQPDWYTGTTAFNLAAFSSAISSFSSATSSYGGASSSSSGGSSGGGFSGGGGGGGGGGGW